MWISRKLWYSLSSQLALMRAANVAMERKIMADLKALKASVADLTARVKNATSVEASVATLVQAVVQQNKDLAAQIAGMDVDTISQSDLDDIKSQVADSATALDDATAALARAAAFDPTATQGGAAAGKFPGNVSGAGNQGGIVGQPGVGSAADPDPALGGSKGGPGQFVGNPPGPSGSDNPDQPRRDQVQAPKPSPLAGTGQPAQVPTEAPPAPAPDQTPVG